MKTISEEVREVPVRKEYDVIVAGGGLGGIAAAIASSRAGAKTLLIERNTFVGGVATAGMCCSIFNCYYTSEHKLGVRGIPVDIADNLAEAMGYGKAWHKHKGHVIYDIELGKLVLQEMLEKAGVDILLDSVVSDTIVEDNTLKGVIIESKSGREALLAKNIVDSTGDADIAYLSGAPVNIPEKDQGNHSLCFRLGNVDVDAFINYFRKNPDQYPEMMDVEWTLNEALAQYDECGTFLFPHGGGMQMDAFKKALASGELPENVGIHDTTDACQMHGMKQTGVVHIVTGFTHFDGLDIEKISRSINDGRKMAYQVTDVYRKYLPGFEKSFVAGVAANLGVRSSRWLDGDFVYKNDMFKPGVRFDDAVGTFVAYEHKVLHPGEKAWGAQVMSNDTTDLPFRSLLPKKIAGLIMGSGRSISSENPWTLRVMVNAMVIGQAAGTAAAVACSNNVAVNRVDVGLIQKELKKQGVGDTLSIGSPMSTPAKQFKVLYSDDLTHIGTCVSPYHKKGELFRQEMIERDVDEVADAGADIHLLQPGLGWSPMWRSQVLPFEEHYRWVKERYGCADSVFDRYLLKGGDIVQVFVDRCRKRGTSPFISLRMNDYHGKHFLDFTREQIAASAKSGAHKTGFLLTQFASRFQAEHHDWRIGPDPDGVAEITNPDAFRDATRLRTQTGHMRVLNWAIPEVREHKFAFIQELCENYDIDGFELDFMRDSYLFPQDSTTSVQRLKIMTDFCARVRDLLERTARSSRRRLCVRIPNHREIHDALGIDIPTWHEAGVDMFNLSCHYCTEQQTQLPQLVAQAPMADFFLELTHTSMRLHRDGAEEYRMMTRDHFRTSAHLAHSQGAAGVSLFNFMYYRLHDARADAVCGEPPFDVVKDLKDPAALADAPQHYFQGTGSQIWDIPGFPLPRQLNAGQPEIFALAMAPPSTGWLCPGRLRVQTHTHGQDRQFKAVFNGCELVETNDVSEPFQTAYQQQGALGRPGELRAWIVPSKAMQTGANTLDLTLVSGDPITIVFIDFAYPLSFILYGGESQ